MTRKAIDPRDYDVVEDGDDIPTNRSRRPTIGELAAGRYSRRDALRVLSSLAGAAATGAGASAGPMPKQNGGIHFDEIKKTKVDPAWQNGHTVEVPEGYDAQVLLKWGDAVTPDAPPHDVYNQSARAQEKQFGYNNDYVAFLPLPYGSNRSDHGLLCVNHEYTDPELMFPKVDNLEARKMMTSEETDVDLAAHGLSIVEIKKENGRWRPVYTGRYNRRITALRTKIRISGPATGHDRMKTKADPAGVMCIGTLNNCAGGVTPWGTVLTCEENVNKYFSGQIKGTPEEKNYARMAFGGQSSGYPTWAEVHARFNIEKVPNEPNRFGWIVEIDPYDPFSMPVKRTALGRFKHEGAVTVLNHDGRVVVYSGDDQRFDYVYKFVSHRRYNPLNRTANKNLLDNGTLYVAQFHPDGTMRWWPLVYGIGPLTPENGFHSQADVMIETRRAADLYGATPMDRPEDVEVSPVTGKVYVMLTNNTKRTRPNPANPRTRNMHGHVVEITPRRRGGQVDHGAVSGRWDVFLKAGNPLDVEDRAAYGCRVPKEGWLSCPDNAAFDRKGRMWIATDGQPYTIGFTDSLYACQTEGENVACPKLFFSAPRGAEVCGPYFTPDSKTLFVAVQHPGAEANSTLANPSTRWPAKPGDPNYEKLPPMPAVVAITRKDGGVIGG